MGNTSVQRAKGPLPGLVRLNESWGQGFAAPTFRTPTTILESEKISTPLLEFWHIVMSE